VICATSNYRGACIGGWSAFPFIIMIRFDRMLIAQARAESLTLATRDETMRKYPIRVLSV